MPALFALLLFALPQDASSPEARTFVDGQKSQGLHAIGEPWEAGKGFIEGGGEGNDLRVGDIEQ